MDEVRKAYKQKARECHPDKNPTRQEQAAEEFKEVHKSYTVLIDPVERKWYDEHREDVLKTKHDPGVFDLEKYFLPNAFRGYSDGSGGFFEVFREVFRAIEREESEWIKGGYEYTDFGHSKTPVDPQLTRFYRKWTGFVSQKSFSWADRYDVRNGENRQSRKWMEKENQKYRDISRREYNSTVRALAKYVRKKDPRMVRKHHPQPSKDVVKKDVGSRVKEEPAWDQMDLEYLAELDSMYNQGNESEEKEAYYCEACGKTFMSIQQWETHSRSKKHLKNVEKQKEESDVSFHTADEDEMDVDIGSEHPCASATENGQGGEGP